MLKSTKYIIVCGLLVLASLVVAPVSAGVVYEIEVTDHTQSPPKSETIHATVEGRFLKLGIAQGTHGRNGKMVFNGEAREMMVVDDDSQTYSVIDQETIKQLVGQLSGFAAQMQEALKNVPEDQRGMVEEMMKKNMPPGMAEEKPASTYGLVRTGDRAEMAGYPCVKYDVLRDGRKLRELWVTDWDNIDGGREAVGAFEDISDFFNEILEAMPQIVQGGGFDSGMIEHMKELDGFPVVTRELDANGELEAESTLRSAKRQALDPDAFDPPSGYKRQQMF